MESIFSNLYFWGALGCYLGVKIEGFYFFSIFHSFVGHPDAYLITHLQGSGNKS